jgi:anion-transporting  ArsA/GET3 family ATPase
MDFEKIVQNKKVIICCGSGGVGKTSLSAALALTAAKKGQKSIVITIDPAKRLATSLGLSDIDDLPKDITPEVEKSLDIKVEGSLTALMLDSEKLLTRTLTKNAKSEMTLEVLFNNRLYKIFAAQHSGMQEYMAVQQLMDIYESNEYDFIVLDTPPTRHALDFLDAPSKLANFFDEKVINWFAKPLSLISSSKDKKQSLGSRIISEGSKIAVGVFKKLTSDNFVDEFVVFINSFYSFRKLFHDTASRMEKLITGNEASFILISSAEQQSILEASFFHERIIRRNLNFLGFIINRTLPEFPKLPDNAKYKGIVQFMENKMNSEKECISQLDGKIGPDQFLIKIREASGDISDITKLNWLSEKVLNVESREKA